MVSSTEVLVDSYFAGKKASILYARKSLSKSKLLNIEAIIPSRFCFKPFSFEAKKRIHNDVKLLENFQLLVDYLQEICNKDKAV